MKTNVFKKAHQITKNIIRKGDSYRETFRLALIFVYSQLKKEVNKMVGTEKQVKWATDIKEEATRIYNGVFTDIKEKTAKAKDGANKEKFVAILSKMEDGYNTIQSMEDASKVITFFKNVKIEDFLFATDLEYLQGKENKKINEEYSFFNKVTRKMGV